MKLVIIAAVANNGTIGMKNTLPWKLKSDLKRFKEITSGHTVICGRKTYESIGKPLPNRNMVVLSRDMDFRAAGCETYVSLEMALWKHATESVVYCIGGSNLYKQALQYAVELDITRVLADVEGDAFFPELGPEWELVEKSDVIQGDDDQYPIQFEKYIWCEKRYDKILAK